MSSFFVAVQSFFEQIVALMRSSIHHGATIEFKSNSIDSRFLSQIALGQRYFILVLLVRCSQRVRLTEDRPQLTFLSVCRLGVCIIYHHFRPSFDHRHCDDELTKAQRQVLLISCARKLTKVQSAGSCPLNRAKIGKSFASYCRLHQAVDPTRRTTFTLAQRKVI